MEIWLHSRPVHGSIANGPGVRSVVWVQGCAIRCPGCHNPETHGFYARVAVPVSALAEELASLAADGVSLSGGEPVHQIDRVLALVIQTNALRAKKGLRRLSWGLFSGYTEEELEMARYQVLERGLPVAVDPERGEMLWQHLKALLDFAVLGRFEASRRNPFSILASENQELKIYGTLAESSFRREALDEIVVDGAEIVRTGFGTGTLESMLQEK